MANQVHPISKGIIKSNAFTSSRGNLRNMLEVGIKPDEICRDFNPLLRVGDYAFKLVFEPIKKDNVKDSGCEKSA